jgi:hypothetical protein
MKFKFLQTGFNFKPYAPDDYYYQFDTPKFQLKNTVKYIVIPTVNTLPGSLSPPRTALDYSVWAYNWTPGDTFSDTQNLQNPLLNLYKGIVPNIDIPTGGPNAIDYFTLNRYPSDTGYTFSSNPSAPNKISTWNAFKTMVSQIPAGRRVLDARYWYNEIVPGTARSWEYYKATADGTTYNNARFLSLWSDKNVEDASSSFNAFLQLANNEGVSFDYISTDFESYESKMIDGIFSYTSSPNTWSGITADARYFSAWLADSRFISYVFPKTQKTFAQQFYDNYIEIVNNDPNIPDTFITKNTLRWGSGLTSASSKINNFMDQWYPISTASPAEFGVNTPGFSDIPGVTSGLLKYINAYDATNTNFAQYSTTETGGLTGQTGTSIHKLMGQTLDDVKYVVFNDQIAVTLKNNGYVIPWGGDVSFGLNNKKLGGTNVSGNAYGETGPSVGSPNRLIGLPVQILGQTLQAKEIAVSYGNICAIKSNDTVVCLGDNSFDVAIPTGLTASKIAAGVDHFVALLGNKGITAWGANWAGQCNVPVGLTGINISAGNGYTCVVTAGGGITCWGDNSGSQCNVPVGLTANQVVCTNGLSIYTKALKADGSVVIWGTNDPDYRVLGTNSNGSGITLPAILTGQSVKYFGITLTNAASLNTNPYLFQSVAINIKNTNPQNALQILSPYLGVTFANSIGLRNAALYWRPYGCGSTCGCGPLGSEDAYKSRYPELAGYTWSMYSIFHALAPAWFKTSTDLIYNNYYKSIYYDNLKKPQYASYNNVITMSYENNPTSNEEVQFRQDSNIRHVAFTPNTWQAGAGTFYMPSGLNLIFQAYGYGNDSLTIPAGAGLLNSPTAFASAWSERSGYVREPETDFERYNFYGYIDVNAGITCSDTFGRLVRYPLTNVFGTQADTTTNYYKFVEEYRYKLFVYYVKSLRQDHRSNSSHWEKYAPFIWNHNSFWQLYKDQNGTELFVSIADSTDKIHMAYWYEFNFHLLLHGTKIFQLFKTDFEQSQRVLDIWRDLSKNSQARPCSNSTADITSPVDRILLHEAFDNYVLSGGKSLATNEYIWRITVPVHLFDENGLITLNRVGDNSDFPKSVILDRNADNPENRVGFWLRTKSQIVPEYTIT